MIKKTLLFLLMATSMLSAVCMPKSRVVENPLIGATNTQTIDIAKIELSDTATVLHVEAYFRPKSWIKIVSDTYLQADGQKYLITGSEGIQLDSLFWMPDSGRASFTLKFGALPRGVKSFDFIESDNPGSYKLYNIDLTGRKEYPAYPDQFPKALRKTPKDGPVPDPIFKMGETTVKLHLLGFHKGFVEKVKLDVIPLLHPPRSYTATVDADGIATFTFKQYGPGNAYAFNAKTNRVFGDFWIAPGETMDVYVDLAESGKALVARRNGQNVRSIRPFLYSTGSYGDLSTLFAQAGGRAISLNAYTPDFADYRISADEYTQMVESKYKTLADSIARSDAGTMVKEIRLLNLQQEILGALTRIKFHLQLNYRAVNKQWDYSVKIDPNLFAKLEKRHFEQIARLFDIDNPKLSLGLNSPEYLGLVNNQNIRELIAPDGFLGELYKVAPMPYKAENNELTEEDVAMLRTLKNPLFAQAYPDIQEETRKILIQTKNIVTEQAPTNSCDSLFNAIIAPYKGKVVLVDFWNTWCGPCQAAIQQTEPLKSDELKSDELVWIYIANETSPIGTYKTNIAKIQGKHYRLNPEQWDYLYQKFRIDGIPSYVLVEKDGSYKLRNDFRDHNLMKKTLKAMIEQP